MPITQRQFDALCSLAFNIGAHAFEKSTLLSKLNEGNYSGAADEFARWNKAGGQVLPGLVKRRTDEFELFTNSQPEPQQGKETKIPIPAIVGAVLPSLVETIPSLVRLFGKGERTEKNAQAAEKVLEIVQEATKATNAQEAVEKVQSDPVAREAAVSAIEDNWFQLIEAGGGGIEGARKADFEARARGDLLNSPSFWVALLLLPLVYMIVANVIGVIGIPLSDEVRSAISNGVVVLILGGLIGYYYGTTTSRNRT